MPRVVAGPSVKMMRVELGAPAEFPGPRLTLFSALRVIERKVVEFSLNNSSLHRISRGVRFRTRN